MDTRPHVQIVRDPAKAALFLLPARLRILEQLADPNSSSGVARLLELPRQQVNYHLRELEREGFVEFVEERRKGNCNERIVRATAMSYLVSPEALGRLGTSPTSPDAQRDRFSVSYLIAAAARIIRDLASLSVRAAAARKRIATITLETEVRFRNPEDRNGFAEELANTLASLSARYHDAKSPEARAFRFVVGGYPVITRPEVNDGQSAVIH